jgi:dihydroorotate dehydrogenase electron transfer subunit
VTIHGVFPVLKNERVAGVTYRMAVLAPGIAEFAQAGQFVTARAVTDHDPLLRRPFGVHRVHQGMRGALEVLYRVVGKGTRLLTRIGKGDRVDLLGPLGRGFGTHPGKAVHLLVAGGIGVAPFPLLAERLRAQDPAAGVRLFFGGKTAGDLAGLDALEPWCGEVHLTTEDGSRGEQALVTAPLARALEGIDPASAVIYACGPLKMLAAAAKLAAAKGVACEVSLESQMACGMGTCLGCVTRTIPVADGVGLPATCDPCSTKGAQDCYQRVCTEGPVFDARAIAWGA